MFSQSQFRKEKETEETLFASTMFSPSQAQALLQQQKSREILLATALLLQHRQAGARLGGAAALGLTSAFPLPAAHDPLAMMHLIRASALSSAREQQPTGPFRTAAVVSPAASPTKPDDEAREDESDKTSDEEFFGGKQADNTERDPKAESFPMKLYRMLYQAEMAGKEEIVSFSTTGHAFFIHKPCEFMSEIMPSYFATNRMASFQRQLNLYGFRRLTHGPDKGGYCHRLFVKGARSQCKKIKRKSQTLGGSKIMSSYTQYAAATTFQSPFIQAQQLNAAALAQIGYLQNFAPATVRSGGPASSLVEIMKRGMAENQTS